MFQQLRVSRRGSILIGVTFLFCMLAFVAARDAHAQNTNLSDHVNGYTLGDFENQSTFDFGFGPGISSQGGVLYNGPATAVVSADANNNPSGVWSDFGDIQPQYYTGNTNLLFYQQSTTGATHGSKAI